MATHRALPLGGNAGLNFDVVGGTSAPTNPKDNTIWVNTSTPIHHWSLNGKEPNKRSNNRNLIVYPFYQSTGTWNGITYTASSDGSLTVNGTATQDTYFFFRGKDVNDAFPISKGTYMISGCPAGGVYGSTYSLEFGVSYDNCASWTYAVDYGSGATLSVSNGAVAEIVFIIYSGATVSNLVVKPQLEKGSSATSFVKGDATGQVWIKTLNSGGVLSFNALKKNAINTNISKVYQYDGTEWKAMSGSIYNNGTSILDYEPQTSSAVLSVSKAQSSNAVTAYSSTISIPSGYSSVVFTAYSHPTIYGTVKTSVIIDGITKNTRDSTYNGSGQVYSGSEITLNTKYTCSTSIQLYLYLSRNNGVSDSTATATFSVTYYFE